MSFNYDAWLISRVIGGNVKGIPRETPQVTNRPEFHHTSRFRTLMTAVNTSSSFFDNFTSGCGHKEECGCSTICFNCCACADSRPHRDDYSVDINGSPNNLGSKRWSQYCDFCASFWERQAQMTGMSPLNFRNPGRPTSLPSPASGPPKKSGKQRRKERRRNEKVDQDPPNSPSISDKASTSTSNPRPRNRPVVKLPGPGAYSSPTVRLQNQTSSSNDRITSPSSQPGPMSWFPPGQQLKTFDGRRNSHGDGLSAIAPNPGPPRRPVTCTLQTISAPNPGRRNSTSNPLTLEERWGARNWEDPLGADAIDGSSEPAWSDYLENELRRPSAACSGTSTPRVTQVQLLNPAPVNSMAPSSTPVSVPGSQTNWSPVGRSSTGSGRRVSANVQPPWGGYGGYMPYQPPGNLSRTEYPPVIANTQSGVSGNQPTNINSNNENQGWFGWAGPRLSNSQNHVLEHVNYSAPSIIPSAPTVAWSPLRMQPLVNDPDLRRQIRTNSISTINSEPPSTIAAENDETPVRPEVPAELRAYFQYHREHQAGIQRERTREGRNTTPRIPIATARGTSNNPNLWPNSSPAPSRIDTPPNSSPLGSSDDEFLGGAQPRNIRARQPTPVQIIESPVLGFQTDADEWETWEVPMTPVAPPIRDPSSLDLAQIAEDASVLLELFSKTKPTNDQNIDEEHKQMIESAFESIVKIRTEFRLIAARKNQNLTSLEPTEDDSQGVKVESECIICYSQVADTVLLPCKHLVLCITCCDRMGINEKDIPGPRTVQCPICRAIVLDRLKIFRG